MLRAMSAGMLVERFAYLGSLLLCSCSTGNGTTGGPSANSGGRALDIASGGRAASAAGGALSTSGHEPANANGGLQATGGEQTGGAAGGSAAEAVGGSAAGDFGGAGTAAGGQNDGVACGSDGLRCTSTQICVESTIYPNNVDPNHVYPPSTTWACKDNPCGSEPLSCDCARSACGYPECSVPSSRKLSCVLRAVCASPDTLIATPSGERRIAELGAGDLVYSADHASLRAVPILRTSKTPVSAHEVVELRTEDGSVFEISAGHPTADGRSFGELRQGDRLDGALVISSRRVPYHYSFTYDILPDSETRTYVAFGKLIGTTLR